MIQDFDFIVVGGGMAGASAAWELSRDGRVVVLEREEQLAFHATGRSAAIFMETYGNGPVRALTSGSRPFYEAPPEGFTEEPLTSPRGALFLAEASQLDELHALHDAVRPLVPSVTLVDGPDLARIVPCLAPGRWAAGLHEPGAVDLDVHEIHQGFLRGLRARRGVVVPSAPVERIERAAGRFTATTPAGAFRAPVLVNAAGAWADEVARLAGARPVGLKPLRRTAIAIDPGQEVGAWPFTGDLSEEFYFKPDARRLLVSPCDETPTEPGHAVPDDYDVAVAVDRLERATTLSVAHVPHRWAGLRSFVADRTPVVGRDPEVEGLVWYAAQGGYGIQTAPALARLCRALALGEGVPKDLAALGLTEEALRPGRASLGAS